MFEGSCVALVTPFKNGKIDFESLEKLVRFHIVHETSWVLPCGTTGESATLSHDEHEAVIEAVVKYAQKKIKVIAGAGSNNTSECIRLTTFAKKTGADAALLISPYYNKPTQKGLYLHFKAVADAVEIPIMLYNIQSRTGVNIEPETISKLCADSKNIIAIKEASGSLEQMSKIKYLAPNIELLSGDDALTLPLLAIGGIGVVSVAANLVPSTVAELVRSYLKGDIKQSQKLHYKLLTLVKSLFIETNPIPVKTAMGMLGMCSDEMRLPMSPMEDSNKERLKKAMKEYGLILANSQ